MSNALEEADDEATHSQEAWGTSSGENSSKHELFVDSHAEKAQATLNTTRGSTMPADPISRSVCTISGVVPDELHQEQESKHTSTEDAPIVESPKGCPGTALNGANKSIVWWKIEGIKTACSSMNG